MQTDLKLQQLVTSLVNDAGVPRGIAVAIATSIEHSLTSPDYAACYGTINVNALKEFINTVSPT